MPLELPSLALVGTQGSGKTTIAKLLVYEHDYLQHSWADPVRHIFEMAYGEITDYAAVKARQYEVQLPDGTRTRRTGRELLQRIGTDAIRDNVDAEFWIKTGIRRIWRSQMVNDDTRFLNEAAALKARGWLIVRVVASEDVRRGRIGSAFQASAHASEKEQESIVEDYTLVNENKDIADVIAELLTFLRSTDMSFLGQTSRALNEG